MDACRLVVRSRSDGAAVAAALVDATELILAAAACADEMVMAGCSSWEKKRWAA